MARHGKRSDLGLVSRVMIANLKNDVRQYGYTIRTTDSSTFLSRAKISYSSMHQIAELGQPAHARRQLRGLMAKTAGLIAIDTNAIGDAAAAQRWFMLAGSLARENGDPLIFSWVTAYEAMSYLWHGHHPVLALELAGRARRIAGAIPSTSAALSAAIEARAYARTGSPVQARRSLDDAESLWSRLEPGLGEDETAFGFYEQLLRMYQSDVLTVLGENFSGAYEAQARAVALAPRCAGMDVDTALVLLDRAICLAKEGEIAEAAAVAADTLRRMPVSFRSGTAAQRAMNVVEIARAAGAVMLVEELEDLLREPAGDPEDHFSDH
jgi:hypothetical protein